ncbi:DNA starvation/stationary phase protection protein [Ancylothrix sp. C2]|uniref:Dps family protein n=1 Tax=Ancylothrix sp. D3o TaxID=2953691 RepID=UPI0021BBADA3|nr:Dps family protein [Ancylothrix sp. D3o]MCT7949743.1 DNA starvation/stationary phase protection protein [Ancylothrix sp. D3o]
MTFNSWENLPAFSEINLGIGSEKRQEVAAGLSRVLADSYTLYLKTYNFCWNVRGPLFIVLHQLFEQQHAQLGDALQKIAERIRTLGFPTPATFAEFSSLSVIQETEGILSAEKMICSLIEGHETLVRTVRSVLRLAQQADDQVTALMLIQQMQIYEKNAWILRTLLEG